VVDDQCAAWIGREVPSSLEIGRPLRLERVYRYEQVAARDREYDRYGIDSANGMDGGEDAVTGRSEPIEAVGFVESGRVRSAQSRP
jgi:hypothetical protein